MFDYSTKDGRAMALQHLDHAHGDQVGKDLEETDETMGGDRRKVDSAHLEDIRR